MDIDFGFWAALLVTAGVVGVGIEAWTSLINGWRGRDHENRKQDREHKHLIADHEAERNHQQTLQRQSLEHEREMKAVDRRHERLSRRDENHDTQRLRFAETTARFLEWVEVAGGSLYGYEEGDWVPTLTEQPRFTSPGTAAAGIWEVARLHPTEEVRIAASSLFDSITTQYGAVDYDHEGRGSTGIDPPSSTFADWAERASHLLDMINRPLEDPDEAPTTPALPQPLT